MIHKDEYIDWKKHPVTEEFFKNIEYILTIVEGSLLEGSTLHSHPHMAEQLGLIKAYRSVVEYRPDFNSDGYMVDDLGDIVE